MTSLDIWAGCDVGAGTGSCRWFREGCVAECVPAHRASVSRGRSDGGYVAPCFMRAVICREQTEGCDLVLYLFKISIPDMVILLKS